MNTIIASFCLLAAASAGAAVAGTEPAPAPAPENCGDKGSHGGHLSDPHDCEHPKPETH